MVDLISGVLDYSGAIDLPQYYVKDLAVVDKFSTNEAELGVKVEIVLGRRLLNQLLTTFMPTTFICLVAISTNFFRVGNFILSDQVNSHTSKQQPSGEKKFAPIFSPRISMSSSLSTSPSSSSCPRSSSACWTPCHGRLTSR